MNEIIVTIQFFTFLIGLLFGCYIFVKNPRNHIFQVFCLTVLGVVGWNLSILLLLTGSVPPLLPGKLAFSFVTLIAVALAFFVSIFPRPIKHVRILNVFNIAIGLLFFILPLLPVFVSEVFLVDGHITGDLNLPLFGFWLLHYVLTLLVSLFVLIFRTRKFIGVERNRALQILAGFSLFLFPMLMTQAILPLFFNDFRWNNLGPVFTIFLLIFIGSAIINYRLFDIRWIVGKSLLFSSLIAIVIWAIMSIAFLLSGVLGQTIAIVIASLVVVVFYNPLWKGIDYLVNKIVNYGSYDPVKATDELFDIVRTEGELTELTRTLFDRFKHYFAANEIALYVYQPNTSKILDFTCEGFPQSCERAAGPLAVMAREAGYKIIEREEVIWQQKFGVDAKRLERELPWLDVLNRYKLETVVPFTIDNRLVALMAFGGRNGDAALHVRDVRFLDLVRAAISPALENAAKFEEIKKLYENLAELDKAKSEFINVVSHRFRTPLSAIRWNLETVLDVYKDELAKDIHHSLTDTHDRTLFLIDTLDRLFESLALESGKFRLRPEAFSLKELFTDMQGEVKRSCENAHIRCSIKLTDAEVVADGKRIVSAVKSIITNAIQYTPPGGYIKVLVEPTATGIEVVVEDTGIGIPKEAQEKIYDKFYRAKNAILTYADGQGLGLYFVKKVVELHGGKIQLKSQLGVGTTFTLRIPAKVVITKKKAKKGK